jgi:FtsP/CotA-like multicopper oxidase with cupredoxin domain
MTSNGKVPSTHVISPLCRFKVIGYVTRGPGLLRAAILAVTLLLLAPAASAGVSRWLSWNAAARSVSLTLVAGFDGSNNGFNFDGYGRGKLLVRVPLGWRVTVTCKNAGTMRHSCAIVRGPMTAAPAFRGATTSNPVLGLRPGQTAQFTFTASRAGSFRIACLVAGHEEARMWDVLVVGGVKRPTISTRTGF